MTDLSQCDHVDTCRYGLPVGFAVSNGSLIQGDGSIKTRFSILSTLRLLVGAVLLVWTELLRHHIDRVEIHRGNNLAGFP
jgi:hypothetical protein